MGCGATKPVIDIEIAPHDVDFKGNVIVIGAGASGLVAGKLLKDRGINFQIIEASSRFGGRIRDANSKVENFAEFRVAIGAEWVHSKGMAGHDAKCPVFDDITDGNSPEHAIFPDKVQDLNVYKNGKVKSLGSLSMDKKFFNMDGDNKFSNSSWYNVLETRILPSIRDSIVYNQPVAAIDYKQEKVVVTTKDGTTYEADKVLVTVPLSILQQNLITFDPPMPADKVADIQKIKTLPGVKVFMEFKDKFYPHVLMMKPFTQGGWAHMYVDETVGKTGDHKKNIMCAVLLGDDVYKLITQNGSDDVSIKNYCLQELDGIFNGQATQNFIDNYVVMNWTTEPHILMGIPDLHEKKPQDLKNLATPLANKVFFAGDAMNPVPHNTAYVQGACESSYIAVKNMITSNSTA